MDRIRHGVDQLNASGALPYKLSFSMGCAVYQYEERLSAEAFLNRADLLMYEDKRGKSAARAGA